VQVLRNTQQAALLGACRHFGCGGKCHVIT
jgi:hypothetical protein